ncbi:hypothetical protein ACIBLA_18165 [Streptomyces sp. NPDC050433]|uniref:hypothetical protein n=1 Tax=Streptomyces sp. NPDC050433 TaxID=3365615 RepID=UPI0037A985BF
MSVDRPGHDPAGDAIAVLTHLRRRAYPAGILAVDRAYSSARPETFHDLARDLDYRLVFAYRIDQLGVQGSNARALLIDGGRHCPKALTGRTRRPAPALPRAGTRPTAACPLKRRSLGRDPRLAVVDVTPSPAGPPEICRRESVTFNRRTGSRFWQETEHGSALWVHR